MAAPPATLPELVVLHAAETRPAVRELLARAMLDVAREELNGTGERRGELLTRTTVGAAQ